MRYGLEIQVLIILVLVFGMIKEILVNIKVIAFMNHMKGYVEKSIKKDKDYSLSLNFILNLSSPRITSPPIKKNTILKLEKVIGSFGTSSVVGPITIA